MPRLVNRNPKYCHHRGSGQAYVVIDGRNLYLGPHGSKRSKEAYDRLVAEWLQNRRSLPGGTSALLVSNLIVAFWSYAQIHYRNADGTASTELDLFKYA